MTRSGAGLEFGNPRPLFQVYGSAYYVRYDVAHDGQGFLITRDFENGLPPPITLVTHWTATLRR